MQHKKGYVAICITVYKFPANNGLVLCYARVRYSLEICELSRVINHKTEDFISTIIHLYFFTFKCLLYQ